MQSPTTISLTSPFIPTLSNETSLNVRTSNLSPLLSLPPTPQQQITKIRTDFSISPPLALDPPADWNNLPLTIIIKLLANMRKNGITIFPKSYQRDRRIEWRDFTVNQQEKIIIGWNKLTSEEKNLVLNEVRLRCPLKGSDPNHTNAKSQEDPAPPPPINQESTDISSSSITPAKRSRIEGDNVIVVEENDEKDRVMLAKWDHSREIDFPSPSSTERIELVKIGSNLLLGAAKEVDDPEIKKRKLDLVEKVALDIIKKGMGA
jgi:hypothetical protein